MAERIHRNSLKADHKLHWYVIEKVLGQGGFGITYLANDTNLDHKVAIKEYLPLELAVREQDDSVYPATEKNSERFSWGLDRFINEARTLAKFKHPAIVRVLSVFEANNTAYMVMEYERGDPLQEILSKRKTLEEGELMKIIIPILGGLRAIHEKGFIHRDIKPGNIILRHDQSPVLLDFGSARQALGQETRTLTSVVSPGFAPFEQYYSKSDKQGPWTDIYGMGATLYRAISGRAPMDAIDRSEALLRADKDIFVPAVEVGAGRYSQRFLRAIDHSLKFREKERPQSITEWLEEFGVPDEISLTTNFTAASETATVAADRTRFELPDITLSGESVEESPPEVSAPQVSVPASQPNSQPASQPASQPPPSQQPSQQYPQNATQGGESQPVFYPQQAPNSAPNPAVYGPASAPMSGPYTMQPQRSSWMGSVVSGLVTAVVIVVAFIGWQKQDQILAFVGELRGSASSSAPDVIDAGAGQDPGKLAEQMKADSERDARRIQALLDSARLAISSGRITQPRNDNAAAMYEEVLVIDPANEAARKGLADLVKTLASQAGEAAAHEKFDKAIALLDEADSLDPDSAQLGFVREQILAQRSRLEQANVVKAEIVSLLDKALQAKRDGRFATPENDSALGYFRQVLGLDPNNADAESGIEGLVDTLVASANKSIDAGKTTDARKALDEAALIKPDSGAVAQARERIGAAKARNDAARRRTAQLNSLLKNADSDLASLRLISPPVDNALDRYREVLRLDPGNARATAGIEKVVDQFVSLARQAMSTGNFDQAKEYLGSAQDISPDAENVRLATDSMQSRLAERDRARQAQAQREAEAAKKAAEEEKRKKLAAEMERLLAGGGAPAPGPGAGPAPAPVQKQPPAVAITFDGVERKYARYGVSEDGLRSRITAKLQSAGYQIVPVNEALARDDGRLMEVYMRANENTTTGMFSYAIQVGVKERVAMESGNVVFSPEHSWKEGEGGALRTNNLSRLNQLVDTYIRVFLQRYPVPKR